MLVWQCGDDRAESLHPARRAGHGQTLGLKWMWNPESPFYIKPRLDLDLMSWGLHFWKAATKARVDAAAPVLRDLSLLSRQCFERSDSTSAS
jgi:hypothetical protein